MLANGNGYNIYIYGIIIHNHINEWWTFPSIELSIQHTGRIISIKRVFLPPWVDAMINAQDYPKDAAQTSLLISRICLQRFPAFY